MDNSDAVVFHMRCPLLGDDACFNGLTRFHVGLWRSRTWPEIAEGSR